MEAWDDERRVRPVPIDDDDTFSGGDVPRVRDSDGWTKRPWIPIALSAAAVVGVLASVTAFGALQSTDPEPVDTAIFANEPVTEDDEPAPPPTLPPSLQEVIPGITDRLTLVVVGEEGPASLLWDPTFIEPKFVPLDVPTSVDSSFTASFDVSGRFLALAETPKGETLGAGGPVGTTRGSGLYLGIPSDLGTLDAIGVRDFEWHASEVGRIAMIHPDNDNTLRVWTAQVNPLSKSLTDAVEGPATDGANDIVRWDTDGMILANRLSGTIHAFDPEGNEEWAVKGFAVAASAETVLVSPFPAINQVTSVEVYTRDGEKLDPLFTEALGGDILLRSAWLSRNTDLVARVDVRSDRTRLEVRGPAIAAVRIVQHNEYVPPLGFTSNDVYFTFETKNTNDLVFINWNSGSIHELDVPDGYDVIGFDIG